METDRLLIDEQFLPYAQDLVANAKKRIYITTFKAELTTKPRGHRVLKFFEQVFEKSRLGLDVRVIISKSEDYGHIPVTNAYAAQKMRLEKVPFRHLRNSRLCHAKILIIDDDVAIVGSHNLGVKSCHNNFEVSYVLHDSYLVGVLIGVYKAIWDNAKKG